MTKNRKLKVVIGIIAFFAALLLIYIVLRAVDEREEVWGEDEEDSLDDAEIIFDNTIYVLDHPVKSYLIMGTDASGNEEAKGEEYQGAMADFLLLMVVDEQEKKYGFLEINRDTVAEIPMMDHRGEAIEYRDMHLCTAHWYGGSKRQSCINTVNAVSTFLCDVPINGYLAIPMDHISDLNHLLGGVTVTLEDDFTDVDSSMKVGETLTLTDEQAAIFLRSRMSVGDGENRSRMRRQKAYMEAAFEQIRQQNAGNAKFLAKAYDQVMEYATSDINMKVISRLSQHMDEYESLGILQIAGESTEGDTLQDGVIHAEFYADPDSIKEVVFKLYPLVDSGIKADDDI